MAFWYVKQGYLFIKQKSKNFIKRELTCQGMKFYSSSTNTALFPVQLDEFENLYLNTKRQRIEETSNEKQKKAVQALEWEEREVHKNISKIIKVRHNIRGAFSIFVPSLLKQEAQHWSS